MPVLCGGGCVKGLGRGCVQGGVWRECVVEGVCSEGGRVRCVCKRERESL